MGEAKRRKAAMSADSTVVPIATLIDPVASLRRFLDKMPDERLMSRFNYGADRARSLEVYRACLSCPVMDLFVARDGQEILGIFEGTNHGRRVNPRLYEVSLLCMPGTADALFKYARKVRPPPTYYFVGVAMDAYSVPIHKFMMHYLDAIMLTDIRELRALVNRKAGPVHIPMVTLWERHPSSDPDLRPPLNDAILRGAPLTPETIAGARLMGSMEIGKIKGLDPTNALEAATKIVSAEKAWHEYRILNGCSLMEAIEHTRKL